MAQRTYRKRLKKAINDKERWEICGDGLRRMKNTKEGNKCEDNSYSYVVDRICYEYGARFTSTFLRR